MLSSVSRSGVFVAGRVKIAAKINWLMGSKPMKRRIGLAILLILSVGAWQASPARETPAEPTVEESSQTPLERGVAAWRRGDYETALALFRRLAEAGDPKAQFYLAEMYDEGQGTKKDAAEAARWIGRAADQGFAGAQNSQIGRASCRERVLFAV